MNARRTILWATAGAAVLIAAPALFAWPPRLIWNASASAPVGLYAMHAARRLEVGDLVAVRPPDALAAFLAGRGYLPLDVPLIKRVLALAGTQVCRKGATIIAYDHVYGEALDRDRLGRALPRWQGCRVLAEGEVFLMNWDAADSLDGRYFGPLPVTAITAKLSPLWTDEDGDGRFEWRAGAR
ncbi:S26 family signal peptidase [Manganibacter manganicus]|uniref:S26 family signal peptidase n=1 Tax=Manganibacter manganicus TaxID=1873176 RepID=A0A1V8RU90_9HYPH|nr:S26 family signal peptidase [Pseudaminobacter manganicus]OQM76713.1 S26 family signal peptidase [Pseudaminobacter manganicus]